MERGEVLRSVVVLGSDAIERVVTSGIFSLDGQDFDVDNNVWLVGDEREVLVVDAAHDHAADPRRDRAGGRWWRSSPPTATTTTSTPPTRWPTAVGAPILLHPDDAELWGHVYPDRPLGPGPRRRRRAARRRPRAAGAPHARPHARAACACGTRRAGWCSAPTRSSRAVPAPPGRSFSSFPTIIESIRTKLLTLPPDTVGPHRPRRRHPHRRRGPPPRGVDRPGQLTP